MSTDTIHSMSTRRYNLTDVINEQSYLQVPRWLKDKKGINPDLKYLYVLMYDLQKVSLKNGWSDELGQDYIYMSKETIMEEMECARQKAIRLKKELMKLGLIDDIQTGSNKPNRIYVKKPWEY